MSLGNLEGAVRQYYEDPGVVAGYAAIVPEGLTTFEAALIRRSFPPASRVLDVGCGAGREAIAMAQAGLEVVAVDLIPEMARLTAANATGRQLRILALAGGAGCLPFRPETFDGVAMLGQLISFLPSRPLRRRALCEAWRILRPGGTLIMTTHNRRCHWRFRLYFAAVNPWRRLLRRLGRGSGLDVNDRWSARDLAGRPVASQRLYFHMYDQEEAADDLRAAGFKILRAADRGEFVAGRADPTGRRQDYLLGFIARRPENRT